MEKHSDILRQEDDYLREFSDQRAEQEHNETIIYRKLQIDDYDKGYFEVLSNLTETGDVTKEQFETRFNEIDPNKSDTYKIVVGVDVENDKIVANGTLVIEKKFIRNCSKCGHIEDIVVHKDYGKRGIGGDIMETLKQIAKINH